MEGSSNCVKKVICANRPMMNPKMIRAAPAMIFKGNFRLLFTCSWWGVVMVVIMAVMGCRINNFIKYALFELFVGFYNP